MRGGLDEALSRLARRDELRRRAAGQAAGTPQAVTELVEAVAAVVARHPELAITMGVEGAGDPVLLQFALEDGVVQVTADNTVAGRIPDAAAPAAARHADFDIDLDVADDTRAASSPDPVVADDGTPTGFDPEPGYGPQTGHRAEPGYNPEPGYRSEPDRRESGRSADHETYELAGYRLESPTQRLYTPEPVPSPLAATPPPPVPPQSLHPAGRDEAARPSPHRQPDLKPLPKPEPLRLEPEATELAAKRLAAMLREDPSLLHQPLPD